MRTQLISKEYLEQEYVKNRKTVQSICLEFKTTAHTVKKYLKQYNIPIRNNSESKIKHIEGQKFGKLTVVEFSHIGGSSNNAYWKCVCDCGKEKVANSNYLKQNKGLPKSCGCSYYYTGGKYITGAEFGYAKKAAEYRNLEFSITIQDIEDLYEKQNKKCRFTGELLEFNSRRINTNGKIICGNASIDRIDSLKGYTKDNIQIVHKDINMAKQAKSDEDFIEMCKKVVKYNVKHNSSNN